MVWVYVWIVVKDGWRLLSRSALSKDGRDFFCSLRVLLLASSATCCFILMQILTVCFFNFWCIVSVYLVTNETPSIKDLQPIYKRTNFTFHYLQPLPPPPPPINLYWYLDISFFSFFLFCIFTFVPNLYWIFMCIINVLVTPLSWLCTFSVIRINDDDPTSLAL